MSDKGNNVPNMPDMVAFLDQFATQAENIAGVVAQYHKKLDKEMFPRANDDLINKLTIDFNVVMWTQIFQMGRPKNE